MSQFFPLNSLSLSSQCFKSLLRCCLAKLNPKSTDRTIAVTALVQFSKEMM